MTKLYLTLQISECYIKACSVLLLCPSQCPVLPRVFGACSLFVICHNFADRVSKEANEHPQHLQQPRTLTGSLPSPTHNAQTPRREEPRRGAVITTGRMRFYGCRIIDAGAESGRRVQNAGAPFPACTTSGRNRIQSWNAEPKQPPHAGRRLPPPDRRAPRPHRRLSYRQRSRSHPPPRHAEWSPR